MSVKTHNDPTKICKGDTVTRITKNEVKDSTGNLIETYTEFKGVAHSKWDNVWVTAPTVSGLRDTVKTLYDPTLVDNVAYEITPDDHIPNGTVLHNVAYEGFDDPFSVVIRRNNRWSAIKKDGCTYPFYLEEGLIKGFRMVVGDSVAKVYRDMWLGEYFVVEQGAGWSAKYGSMSEIISHVLSD